MCCQNSTSPPKHGFYSEAVLCYQAPRRSCSTGCETKLPWIKLVGPALPKEAQSDWDLGNMETKATLCTICDVPQTIPDQCVRCGPGFPRRTLARASQSIHQFVVVPQSIMVLSLPWENSTHIYSCSREVKENRTHLTRQPSSTAPSSSSDAHMPIAGAFNGVQGGHHRHSGWWSCDKL